jgi:hypothetical protein
MESEHILDTTLFFSRRYGYSPCPNHNLQYFFLSLSPCSLCESGVQARLYLGGGCEASPYIGIKWHKRHKRHVLVLMFLFLEETSKGNLHVGSVKSPELTCYSRGGHGRVLAEC